MNAPLRPDPVDLLLRAGEVLAIAHHIPGRIRLKLAEGATAAVLSEGRFPTPERLRSVAGVRSVKLNLLARSCVVEYDPTVVPPIAWVDLLAGRRTAASAPLIAALAAVVADRGARPER